MDWEEVLSIAIPVPGVGVLLAIGYFRDRRNHAAFAEFARRYRLAFQPNQPFKRISLHGKVSSKAGSFMPDTSGSGTSCRELARRMMAARSRSLR